MDKTNIQSVSTIVANCIVCEGLVRVPATARANSIVRCPHCLGSFALSQLLDQSIPELEVVDEVGDEMGELPEKIIPVVDRVSVRPSGDDRPREKFVVPHQLSAGAKRKRRHRRRSGSSTSSEVEERSVYKREPGIRSNGSERFNAPSAHNQTASDDTSIAANETIKQPRRVPAEAARRSSRRQSSSRHYEEPNAVVEFLKIAFGGLFAFPIAYLLVLWIFSQDPLGLGPYVSKVAPWAIPINLRGIEDAEANPASDQVTSELTLPATNGTEKIEGKQSEKRTDADIMSNLKDLEGLPGLESEPDDSKSITDELLKTDIKID